MFGGVRFIPRDEIDEAPGEKNKSSSRKKKSRRSKKSFHSNGSSDDELERINEGSRKKKWYSSDEHSSSSESDSEDSADRGKDRKRSKKKKRSANRKKNLSASEEENSDDYSDKKDRGNRKGRRSEKEIVDDGRRSQFLDDTVVVRKEMGLEWMLKPRDNTDERPVIASHDKAEESLVEEKKKFNPKELNPYLKNDGTGYPDEADNTAASQNQLLPSSVVGDGGASWRLKALKRAQEQAAREGLKLEKVVEERWGSLSHLAVSASSHRAAPSRAHLHASKNRQRGRGEERETVAEKKSERDNDKTATRDYLRDVSVRHPEMRAPRVNDSLSWRKRKGQNVSAEDAGVISAAFSSLNKFSNDGNFMSEVLNRQSDGPSSSDGLEGNLEANIPIKTSRPTEDGAGAKEALSANQLAAKAIQLRMKGKHEEAEKLLKEAENMKAKQGTGDTINRARNDESTRRYAMQDTSFKNRKDDDDADLHLAKKIMQSKQHSVSGRADDEYDFEDGPARKSRKKGVGHDRKASQKCNFAKRLSTQQERCLFCFENPNRPRHLVVSIANFTYLMLPQRQPIVPGHCCILPLQHESASRAVDNNVWDEIRNFKKCLIMMFDKQDKDLVFLETVMELAQQRRHCLIECIPLPREIVKEAPLYFKKAIDEAEDEWSQHNAKKLIDTSVKGLRGSIPKDFPYFHVEFGLNKGFVHVIDDEKQFNSRLGLNVIRGMLELPEEDMYRRGRYETVDAQKQAVTSFVKDWEPFDWTKQLS